MDRVEALFLELSGGSQSISVDVILVEDLRKNWVSWKRPGKFTWRIHPVGDEKMPSYEGFIS